MEKAPEDADNKIEPVARAGESESMHGADAKNLFTEDEYQLAQLGYKQEFFRGLGLFENWAATFTSMNFASGIPVLFGFVMYTGGPTAAFANWTMVGGLSFVVSLSMAEIAAALPTAGGIYYCRWFGENPFPISARLVIVSHDNGSRNNPDRAITDSPVT